jgi:hypothetical protein
MQTTGDTQVPGSTLPAFNAIDEPPIVETEQVEQAPESDAGTELAVDESQAPDHAEMQAQEEARKHGWVPKEEWRGPAERWRPASEFLDVRNNVLSLVREENQQLRAKLAAFETKLTARERQEAEDRQKLARESLRLELKSARENQDWDRVDEISEKLLDLKVSAAAAPKSPQIDPQVVELWQSFMGDNKWLADKELAANFAVELKGIEISGAARDIPTALDLAKRRVQRLYPEKFRTNGQRQSRSMVDMGGTPGGATSGRSWSDLLPDVRRQAEADIAAKRYTKEDFLANCDAEHFRR